jgi:hypothetical protein
MRNLIFSSILLIAVLTSCEEKQKSNSSSQGDSELSQESSTGNSQTNQLITMCFQRVEGKSNQDTSTINLLIDGNAVLGNFNWIPFEKDSRKGTIKGTKDGDIIKGVWTFMQEGTNDSLAVEFKLSGDELFQKTFGTDAKTGRQQLTDTSTFSVKYQKINCIN